MKIPVLIIIIIGAVCYANALFGDFLWDDNTLIVRDPYVTSLKYIPDIFSKSLFYKQPSNFYRPIQQLSFLFDYQIWKLNPLGFHLTNILIHIFNAILIYMLCCRIQEAGFKLKPNSNNKPRVCSLKLVALWVSLFWLVSPMHVPIVTYISGRADSLAVMFMLLTMLMQVTRYKLQDAGKKLLHIISYCTYILALLSKELAVIFPLLLTLMVFYTKRHCEPEAKQSQNEMQRLPRSLWSLAMTSKIYPYFIITFVYFILRLTVLNFSVKPILESNAGLYIRLLTSFKSLALLLGLILVPVGLHVERSLPYVNSFFSWELLLSLLVLTGIGWLMVKMYKKEKTISFGIAWMFAAYIPMMNLVPINANIADHWMYLPSIGFFIAIVSITQYVILRLQNVIPVFFTVIPVKAGHQKKNLNILLFILCCVLIMFYSAVTIKRNIHWINPENLYKHTLKYVDAYRMHYSLGLIYDSQQKFDLAVKEYNETLRLNPGHAPAYNNIGVIYNKTNRVDEAITYFKRAIQINPEFGLAHNNLATAYDKKGMIDQAIKEYEQAVRIDKDFAVIHYNLGSAYYKKGRISEAQQEFKTAVKLNPKLFK